MTQYRLLVIEDVKNIADMICKAANEAGFSACSASGANAMAVYDSFSPNVVTLDLLISGMGEFEFLQFLRERGSPAHIIIISGCSHAYRKMAEDVGRSGGLLIEGNIDKPFRINEVKAMLAKVRDSVDAVRKIA